MKQWQNFGLIVLSLVFAYLISPFVGRFYRIIFRDPGSYVDVTAIIGLPLAYIFFLTLLFTALPPRQAGFGDKGKYWWIGIGLIPAAVFELYFDLAHIYFPIAIGLVGWLIGMGIRKIVTK